jgi:hypothetical protein
MSKVLSIIPGKNTINELIQQINNIQTSGDIEINYIKTGWYNELQKIFNKNQDLQYFAIFIDECSCYIYGCNNWKWFPENINPIKKIDNTYKLSKKVSKYCINHIYL